MRPLPPYAKLLNLSFGEQDGSLVVTMPYHDDVVGRPGYLHGGALADDKVMMKPVTVTVDYLRPGGERDTFATATVERLGARIANVEAYAWQDDRTQPIASARLNILLDRPAGG